MPINPTGRYSLKKIVDNPTDDIPLACALDAKADDADGKTLNILIFLKPSHLRVLFNTTADLDGFLLR
jgi:hypothetical protein